MCMCKTACVIFILPEKKYPRHAPEYLYLSSPARLEEMQCASDQVSNAHRRCYGHTKNHPLMKLTNRAKLYDQFDGEMVHIEAPSAPCHSRRMRNIIYMCCYMHSRVE